jgi:hypothetical protein
MRALAGKARRCYAFQLDIQRAVSYVCLSLRQAERLMDPDNRTPDNKSAAQNLMAVHGLRADAVVSERLEESRLGGDAGGLVRWQDIRAAISDLRRSGGAATKA